VTASAPLYIPGANGVRLALDDQGPADGVPVLLLHGGGQTRESWGGVGAALAERGFHALTMDLRGHGESDWSEQDDYEPTALVADVDAVRRSLHRPIVLVGASLGGLISMLYASAHPDDVLAVALVDVVARNSRAGEDRIHDFLSAHPDGFATFEDVVAAVRAYKGHHFREQDQTRLHRNVRKRADGRLVWHWDPEFLLRNGQSWTTGRTDLLSAAASRLPQRTLLLVGGESDVVDEDALGDFVRTTPQATVERIHGASHMVASDENDAFGAALLSWLDDADLGR
jgi:pimeloyl-ACP methyl ester carboxylesterase